MRALHMTGTWTEERVELLTERWREGVSARLIGIEMGLTKNAVVGKAHRMRLEARPSPIGRHGLAPAKNLTLARATKPSEAVVPEMLPASVATVPGQRACQWIEGERGRDFKVYAEAPRCPDEAQPRSSYCPAHHVQCWLEPQPRRAA